MGHKIEAGGGVLPERAVQTPGGTKSIRYPDIISRDPQGQIHYHNVGVSNKNGTPVSREVQAINDLLKATGIRPTYVPNKIR